MKALKKVALPLNYSHPVCRNVWPLTSVTSFAFCTFNPLLIFSLWGEFLSFCCLHSFCLCLNEGTRGWKCVWVGSWWRERWFREGTTPAFGKVLDSENAKLEGFLEITYPQSLILQLRQMGPEKDRESPTVSPGLVKDEWGENSFPSTLFGLFFLLMAHSIFRWWPMAFQPLLVLGSSSWHHSSCKLRKSHSYTHCVCVLITRWWTKKCDVFKGWKKSRKWIFPESFYKEHSPIDTMWLTSGF